MPCSGSLRDGMVLDNNINEGHVVFATSKASLFIFLQGPSTLLSGGEIKANQEFITELRRIPQVQAINGI